MYSMAANIVAQDAQSYTCNVKVKRCVRVSPNFEETPQNNGAVKVGNLKSPFF